MAKTSVAWIFLIFQQLVLLNTKAEENNTTTESITTTTEAINTTTDAGGTITLPAWIIYGLVFPILGIVVIIGTVACCYWMIRKRNGSIVPNNEPGNNRIVNELNTETAGTAQGDKEFVDKFVVTHESKKISKKPKKAVNCMQNKADKSSADPTHETTTSVTTTGRRVVKETVTHPGIDRLNRAIETAKDERENEEVKDCDDAISENAFNHMKEEDVKATQKVTTSRSASMTNKFKLEDETTTKSSKTATEVKAKTKKNYKSKQSALKRNTHLLKSKLNMQTTDISDDTEDPRSEVWSSSTYTDSEEESELDPSIVRSGEDDSITGDEDSGREHSFRRHPKRRKTRVGKAIDISKHGSKSVNTQHDVLNMDQSINIIKQNNTKTQKGTLENSDQISIRNENELIPSSLIIGAAKPDNGPGNKMVGENRKHGLHDVMKTMQTDQSTIHLPRQGPVATSSFKSHGIVKRDNKSGLDKGTPVIEDQHIEVENESIHTAYDARNDKTGVDQLKMANENYMQFEEAVAKCGKLNLNRSMSLNEVDQYKSATMSKRRKRKYQSLRQVRKESVFDVLQKLDTTPKKGILKKSKSLYVKSQMTEKSASQYHTNEDNVEQHIKQKENDDSENEVKEDVRRTDDSNSKRNSAVINKESHTVERTRSVHYNKNEETLEVRQRSKTPDPYTLRSNEDIENIKKRTDLSKFQTKDYERSMHSNITDDVPCEDDLTLPIGKPSTGIVSSNLALESKYTTSACNNIPITGKYNTFTKKDEQTNEDDSIKRLNFDRFSPIPIRQNKDKTLGGQELISKLEPIAKSEMSWSNSDAESTVLIVANQVTFNTDQQAKLKEKLKLHQLNRNEILKPSEDIETIEMPTIEPKEKTPRFDEFQITANTIFGKDAGTEANSEANMNVIYSGNWQRDKLVESPTANKTDSNTSIKVSERGLVFPIYCGSEQTNNMNIISPSISIDTAQSESKDKRETVVSTLAAEQYEKHTKDQEIKPTSINKLGFSVNDFDKTELSQKQKPPDTGHTSPETMYNESPTMEINTLETSSVQQNNTDYNTGNDLCTEYSQKSTGVDGHKELQSQQSKQKCETSKDTSGPLAYLGVQPGETPMLYEHLNKSFSQPRTANPFDYTTESTNIRNPQDIAKFPNELQSNTPVDHFQESESTTTKTPLKPQSANSPYTNQHGQDFEYKSTYIKTERPEKESNACFGTLSTSSSHEKMTDIFHKCSALPAIPINAKVVEKDSIRLESNAGRQHESSVRGKPQSLEPVKLRSKTPTFEISQTPKIFIDAKRSMTPNPTQMNRNNTNESQRPLRRMLIDDLHDKQKKPLVQSIHNTSYKGHLESFSKNFPTTSSKRGGFDYYDPARKFYRTSLRNKTPKQVELDTLKACNGALLSRRKKGENTLVGMQKSRKSPEHVRPKSAMSLRSAPRQTHLESIHTTPKNQRLIPRSKTPNSFAQSSLIESQFSIDKRFPDTSKNNEQWNTKSRVFIDLKTNIPELLDSDSELEEFFANPDVESMQFNSHPEGVNRGFVQKCENTFSAYAQRSKLSKSKSFKV